MRTEGFTVPTMGRERHVDLWVVGVEFESSTSVDAGRKEDGFALEAGCTPFPPEDVGRGKQGDGVGLEFGVDIRLAARIWQRASPG